MTTIIAFIQRSIAALVLSLAVPAVVLVPVTVQAASIHTDRTVVYSTSLQGLNDTTAVPLTGSLHVRISKDGIISGFYRPDYTMDFTPVTGGVDGDHVWLLIGATSPTRVDGTYANGTIAGTAYTPDHAIYQFAATNATLQ